MSVMPVVNVHVEPNDVQAVVSPVDVTVEVASAVLITLPGGGEGGLYTFTQATPALTWTINHNLDTYPTVTVVDSAGTVWDAAVSYTNTNQVVVSLDVLFSGTAYLRY